MPLYFRSDTRSPKEIFRKGFTPIHARCLCSKTNSSWWQFGIGFPKSYEKLIENKNIVTDVASEYVISMTTKLESAPIFPVSPSFLGHEYKSVYIYAIALPESTLPKNFKSTRSFDVFNVHALQLEQTKIISKRDKNTNLGFVSQGLCGYEAFTSEVKPENIIGATKCNRSSLQRLSSGLGVYASKDVYAIPFDRTFEINRKMIVNPKLDNKWKRERDKAVATFQAAFKKGRQKTSSVNAALTEANFDMSNDNVRQIPLILFYLKNGLFGRIPASIVWSLVNSIELLFYDDKSFKKHIPYRRYFSLVLGTAMVLSLSLLSYSLPAILGSGIATMVMTAMGIRKLEKLYQDKHANLASSNNNFILKNYKDEATNKSKKSTQLPKHKTMLPSKKLFDRRSIHAKHINLKTSDRSMKSAKHSLK